VYLDRQHSAFHGTNPELGWQYSVTRARPSPQPSHDGQDNVTRMPATCRLDDRYIARSGKREKAFRDRLRGEILATQAGEDWLSADGICAEREVRIQFPPAASQLTLGPRLPSWAEAHRRLQGEGRRSRVSYPSEAHRCESALKRDPTSG
jgi:hypothetical protein